MSRGIIVFGAPGSGTTTLGKELATRLGFRHFDLDDYHWDWDTEIPYTVFRPTKDRIEHLMRDISKHPHFVMSGSMWSIRESFEPLFDLAVFILVPAEIRAKRLHEREFMRWGNRVLPGGDMFENNDLHKDYFAQASKYDNSGHQEFGLKQHEQWAKELPCPIVRIDGTKDISENVSLIIEQFFLNESLNDFSDNEQSEY